MLIILYGLKINSTFFNQGHNVVQTHNLEMMTLVTNNISNYLEGFFKPAQSVVESSHDLVFDGQLDYLDDKQLQLYFVRQLERNASFSGAFFGRPNGSFIFVKREDKGYKTKIIQTQPTRQVYFETQNLDGEQLNSYLDNQDGYTPIERPWYQKAIESTATIWTEPYTFFTSQKSGVTAAIAVRDKNQRLLGVIGVDVELETLSSYLEQFTLSEYQSFPLLISPNGQIIAKPQNSENARSLLPFFEIDYIEKFLVPQSSQQIMLGEITEIPIADTSYLSLFKRVTTLSSQSWLLGIYAPKAVYSKNIERYYENNITSMVLLWLLFSLLALLLSFLLSKPLKRLQRRATTDSLTGLLNRRAFINKVDRLKLKAEQKKKQSALFIIDLDNFKPINDTYSHVVGDEVLVNVAKRLKHSVRKGDVVARIGGDEFAIFLSSDNQLDLYKLGHKIRKTVLKTPIVSSKAIHSVGLTLGAIYLKESVNPEVSLAYADKALVEGKITGKGDVYIARYTEQSENELKLNLRTPTMIYEDITTSA